MVRLEPGEEPPTERGGAFETLDARMIRELEQMPDSAIQKLSYDQQAELAEFQGARTEQIAAEFIGLRPAYYPVADNYIALLNQLCETYLLQPLANDDEETLLRAEMKLLQRGVFTARHLALAYDALAAEGALFAKPGTRKPLSPAQLRQLTAMCGMDRSIGGLEKALQLYLEYAGCEEDWKDVAENPDYADVYEDAMVWIFSQVQADFRPTPEIRDFLRQYIGDRAPTIALLQHAWLACKEQEGNVTGFEELPATPEDTVAASSTRQFLSQ